MDTVKATIPPCPSVRGQSEGHGEGVEYKGHDYYYRTAKLIPKDKIATVRWEGNWSGRQKGEVEHLILSWNGTDFTVLEHVCYGNLTRAMVKYKGLNHEQAIAVKNAEDEKWRSIWNSHPKCNHCGGNSIGLLDDQPKNVCMECHQKGLK